MKEFQINKLITVKLEERKTNIYIAGDKFRQCKYLLLKKLVAEEIEEFVENFTSIDDEAVETLDTSLDYDPQETIYIPPEVEFWAHCSNLQVWFENNYDTRLLHSNLAFPLLKRLSEAGDLQAKKMFKEEIVRRYSEGNKTVQKFLAAGRYLSLLSSEEQQLLFKRNIKELQEIEKIIGRKLKITSNILLGDNFELIGGEITGLRFYGKSKINIPKQIGLIGSLKKLILKQFIDKEAPKWIGNLTNLEYLNLNGNVFEKLPEGWEGLINLKYLDLGSNKLRVLPNSFNNLKSLERIMLSGNRFEEFPKELLSLDRLHEIILYKNNIKSIPIEIKKLRNLKDFSIAKNPIKSLPDELFALPQLKSLILPNEIKISKDIKEKIKNRKLPLKIFPKKLTDV